MKKITDRIVYYQFSLFQRYSPELRHLVTTRMCGYGKKPYNTLNMGLHVGDDAEDVIRNRELVCKELGYSIDSMVAMQQSHSSNVKVIDDQYKGRGAREWKDGIENTDGIVTNSKNLVLTAMAADCSLSLFYDPVQRVLAVAHSGWKGIASGVLKNIISAMIRTFNCKREHIRVGIGPTICEKCYEVGDDLIEAIAHTFPDHLDKVLSKTRNGAKSINIVKALYIQLCGEGIESNHIESSNLCNACRIKEFYSYRIEKKKTGRFGLFVVLNG